MESKGMKQLSRAISVRIGLPALVTLILFIISIFIIIMPSTEKNFMNGKREMIRKLTETAWHVLDTYHQWELQGMLTTKEAQERALSHIRAFRYGKDNKDYFWINDLDHRLMVHPYRPDLEGQDSSTFEDPTGKRIFVEFVDIAKEYGSGYTQYMWQWLDKPEVVAPKLSYIKLFEPWGWVIGTGVYLDEVRQELANVRKKLAAVSTLFVLAALLLALYSFRHLILADRVRVRIWEERGHLIKDLERSRERYRSLVETTSDWIWEVTQEGVFTYSSPNISGLLGFKSEDIIGKSLPDLCPAEQQQQVAQNFTSMLKQEQPFYGFECECLAKDRRRIPMEINAVPICELEGSITVFRGVARDVTDRKAVMNQLRKSRDKLRSSLEETVTSLSSAAGKRDPYTAGHQLRVKELACAMAEQLGLSKKKIEGLRFATILHDIGKISLPAEYLAKPTPLTPEERAVMKCHAEIGYEILKNIQFPWPVAEIVYQHHELLDGSGYPRGLKDEEILLEAKILTVADVVEAMSSHRPYRPSLGIEAALDEIRAGRGIKYHPQSVDACLHLLNRNMIELTSQTW